MHLGLHHLTLPPEKTQIEPLVAIVDSCPPQTCYGVKGFRIEIRPR